MMGAISTRADEADVLNAIRSAANKIFYLEPAFMAKILRNLAASGDPTDDLSPREIDVFFLIGFGLKNNAIARKLQIRPKTVYAHKEKIKFKLKIANSALLLREAIRWAEGL